MPEKYFGYTGEHRRPIVPITIFDLPSNSIRAFSALIDSGADISVLPYEIGLRIATKTENHFKEIWRGKGMCGKPDCVKLQSFNEKITVDIIGRQFKCEFHVLEEIIRSPEEKEQEDDLILLGRKDFFDFHTIKFAQKGFTLTTTD
ncbi:MAG: hypothetical protein V1708_01370 [Candidatus Micrarchaeota archaeon]